MKDLEKRNLTVVRIGEPIGMLLQQVRGGKERRTVGATQEESGRGKTSPKKKVEAGAGLNRGRWKSQKLGKPRP